MGLLRKSFRMGKGTCRSYRAPCCGILDTQLSFLFSGKKLVKKYAQNSESYPGRYKYLKHYSFSFCFAKIAAPKHVKNTLNPSPTRAILQSSFKADWTKTPPRKTNDIFKKCFPISLAISSPIKIYGNVGRCAFAALTGNVSQICIFVIPVK